MDNIILRKNHTNIFRLILSIISIAILCFCGFKIATAIEYNAITMSGTTGSIEVKGNTIKDLNITPALVFNKTGDSITYKMTLKSPDNNKFQIKNITDDNKNQYITTSYEYDKNMNANEKPIYITLAYSKYLPLGDELNLNDIHIIINIDEETPTQNEGSAVITPNTGSGMEFLKTDASSNNYNVFPYALTAFITGAILLTSLPLPRRHRVAFNKISSIAIIFAISGALSFAAYAESSQLKITIFGENISAVSDTKNPQEVVSVTFPNIYNGNQTIYSERVNAGGPAPGNNIILKTLDNKYVMMDTGPNIAGIKTLIYDELKKLQKTNVVKLDYLVISHLDGDHNGNAVALLNDANFNIENIVFKTEVYPNNIFSVAFIDSAIAAAKAKGTKVITSGGQDAIDYLNSISVASSDYQMLSEGESIQVGKYLKLDFFNTSNVYSGKTCRAGYTIDWTANINATNLYKTDNGEYVYFDGSEYKTYDGEYGLRSAKFPYSNVTLKTTSTPTQKEGGSGINRYFYATSSSGKHSICARNPNSFGILAEITTTNLKRYMYFSGDIENAGYSILSSGANSSQIYDEIVFENGDFNASEFNYAIPSEDNTAITIRNKLISDAKSLGLSQNTLLNNIVLYQMSHHGGNNSEKALWALNLNRKSGIYAIEENSANMATSASWRMAKTYNYTLSELPAENKLRVGASTVTSGTVTNPVGGVDCSINSNGAATCAQY